MWPFPYGVDITIRRVVRDDFSGDRIESHEHILTACYVDEGSTTEANTMGESVVTKPRVFAAYDADVLSADEVVIPGRTGTWQVDGDVLRHRNPFTGWAPMSEFRIMQTRGA